MPTTWRWDSSVVAAVGNGVVLTSVLSKSLCFFFVTKSCIRKSVKCWNQRRFTPALQLKFSGRPLCCRGDSSYRPENIPFVSRASSLGLTYQEAPTVTPPKPTKTFGWSTSFTEQCSVSHPWEACAVYYSRCSSFVFCCLPAERKASPFSRDMAMSSALARSGNWGHPEHCRNICRERIRPQCCDYSDAYNMSIMYFISIISYRHQKMCNMLLPSVFCTRKSKFSYPLRSQIAKRRINQRQLHSGHRLFSQKIWWIAWHDAVLGSA